MALHNPGDSVYRAKRGNLFTTHLPATEPEKPDSYNDPSGRRNRKKIERLLQRDRVAQAGGRTQAQDGRGAHHRPSSTNAAAHTGTRNFLVVEMTRTDRERLFAGVERQCRRLSDRTSSLAERLEYLITEERAARSCAT